MARSSNQAERDVRPAKVQQKISGRLRSEHATRHRYAVRGYISTAAKHGISVFTALRGALSGNPWMPPIPATTKNLPAGNHATRRNRTLRINGPECSRCAVPVPFTPDSGRHRQLGTRGKAALPN